MMSTMKTERIVFGTLTGGVLLYMLLIMHNGDKFERFNKPLVHHLVTRYQEVTSRATKAGFAISAFSTKLVTTTLLTTSPTSGLSPPLAKIQCRSKTGFRIPNLVHHIWFGNRTFKFYHYISMRSAALIQRPDTVFLYYNDTEPQGVYWQRYKDEVPCLVLEKIEAPSSIFNNSINKVEHQADVARLQILLKKGGIYLDTDTVMVKPFDPLMNESTVLGEEVPGAYGNGIILTESNSPFLQFWYGSYKTFNDSEWATHSVFMPARIHREHPELSLHVELDSFLKPNWTNMKWFEDLNWDLSKNYCIHLYARFLRSSTLLMAEKEVSKFNSTYGALSRLSLYGDAALIPR